MTKEEFFERAVEKLHDAWNYAYPTDQAPRQVDVVFLLGRRDLVTGALTLPHVRISQRSPL